MFNKVKSAVMAAKGKVNAVALAVPIGAVAALSSGVTAFASDTGTTELPTVAITTDMLMPLAEGVVANIGVVLPVGLSLFAMFLGIRIIPSLISRFTHA